MPRHPLLHQQLIRSSLVKLYFNSFISYVLYLERLCAFIFSILFFLWSTWLDPSILDWERDTLRFFIWILLFFTYTCWVFLSSYCYAFSSCFACISYSELLVLLKKVLSCFTYNCLESLRWNKLIGVWLEQKMLHVVDGIWKRLTYSCRSLSWIIWYLSIVLSYQVVHV